jgi:hypothetical protein
MHLYPRRVKISDHGSLRGLVASAGVVLLVATGCAGGESEAEPSASPTVSVSGSPSEATVSDEDAVAAIVDRYWAIEIRSQNRGLADPAIFGSPDASVGASARLRREHAVPCLGSGLVKSP